MMAEFGLSRDAENDVLEIARYTIKTWGVDQANRYEAALVDHFQAIGRGEARTSTPLPGRADVCVSKCEHHYVFSYHPPSAKPIIIAVFHEKMDLMTRLRDRLN